VIEPLALDARVLLWREDRAGDLTSAVCAARDRSRAAYPDRNLR